MKFTLILLTFITCLYTILTGLMSSYYDMWNWRIIHYWWLKVYAILINLIILVSAPFFFKCVLLNEEPLNSNDVVYLAINLNSIISMSLVTYTILLRWYRERRVIALTMEFKRLKLEYFDKRSKDNEEMRVLNRFLYAKILVMLYQTIIEYADSENLSFEEELESFMCIFYEISRINITNGVIFQYFMGLWYICSCYHRNNMNLRYLVGQWAKMGSSAALLSQLRKSVDTHNELSRLISLLNDTFKFECLAMLFLYFANNVFTGYFAVFFAVGDAGYADIFEVFVEISFYIGTLLDMLLLIWICDSILRACEETSIIMQQWMILSPSNIRLSRICEQFYLHSACNKLRIRIFDTFNINRRSGFSTISSILLYTIFFVQSDYKYLAV